MRERVLGLQALEAGYGLTHLTPFAWWDRDSHCWRTFQRCLTGEWARFSEAWPRAGMTRNGIAYRLPPSAPLKGATGHSYWPTPRASEWKGTGSLGSSSHEHRLKRGYLDATVQDREQKSGKLNPMWVEWLMGFPPGWTVLKPLETR